MAKQAITLKIAGKSYPFNIESGKEEVYRLAEREVNNYLALIKQQNIKNWNDQFGVVPVCIFSFRYSVVLFSGSFSWWTFVLSSGPPTAVARHCAVHLRMGGDFPVRPPPASRSASHRQFGVRLSRTRSSSDRLSRRALSLCDRFHADSDGLRDRRSALPRAS